jgi:hypothetical protein
MASRLALISRALARPVVRVLLQASHDQLFHLHRNRELGAGRRGIGLRLDVLEATVIGFESLKTMVPVRGSTRTQPSA